MNKVQRSEFRVQGFWFVGCWFFYLRNLRNLWIDLFAPTTDYPQITQIPRLRRYPDYIHYAD
jgi:hypothetical protein